MRRGGWRRVFAPEPRIIQADGVILPCVHLQNGSCDESCVTAHPFADSLLVTHRLSLFFFFLRGAFEARD